jgi:hypothetical protein
MFRFGAWPSGAALVYPSLCKGFAVHFAEPPPVSVEEEQLLLRFYESKVSGLCAELHLPRKVEVSGPGTAARPEHCSRGCLTHIDLTTVVHTSMCTARCAAVLQEVLPLTLLYIK